MQNLGRRWFAGVLTLAACGFAGSIWISRVSNDNSMGHESTLPGNSIVGHTVELTRGALCGNTQYATMLAYKALENSDMSAVTGLIARGEVIDLEQVNVEVLDTEALSAVTVTSGFNIGRTCYIPHGILNTYDLHNRYESNK